MKKIPAQIRSSMEYCLKLFGLFFLLLLHMSLVGCGDPASKLKSGDTAPSFSLYDIRDNHLVKFPEDYQGKVVAIRFWAEWCPYCKQEMGELQPLYEKLQEQGLAIIAVNVRQDQKTALKFIEEVGVSYEAVLDLHGKVTTTYQVMGLPTTYIVDRQGRIATKIVGESKSSLFEKIVSDLL